MRFLRFLVLSVVCASAVHAQVTGAQLLENEPEWAVIKGTGAAPYMTGNRPTSIIASATQNYGRYEAVKGEVISLNERLLDNLLVCEGKCRDQGAREDEFWILQHNLPSYNLAPMKNRAETKVDPRWVSTWPDRDLNDLLQERCDEVTGIKRGEEDHYWDNASDRSVLQTPEKVKQYKDCRAQLVSLGAKHTGIDASRSPGLWNTHVAIWKYCAAMYDVNKSIFQQAAYNSCMNQYDVQTIVRTKYRLSHNRRGDSMGQFPTDQDLALLANVPASFKP